jgi:hypothetical protein
LDQHLRSMLHRARLPAPRTVPLVSFDVVLLFELWISVHQIISFRPAVPSYYSSCGFRSLELFPLGQQRRLIIWVVDFCSSNQFFSASSADLLFK